MTTTRISTLGILLTGLVALSGCDKLADAAKAIKKGGEAAADVAAAAGAVAGNGAGPMTEDDKLGEKLNGYISCINGVSKRVHDSAGRYYQWVDPEKGLTGSERHIYGLYEVSNADDCKQAITKSNEAEPRMEDLEGAATAFSTALDGVVPLIADAHKYYDEENYKDDSFAKGKELHTKLVAGFKAFDEADLKLRDLVKEHNEALHVRELERIEKEEGRKLRFHTQNVMMEAKHLLAAADAPFEELDSEAYSAVLTKFESAVDECETYSKGHKKETDSVMMYSMFIDAAQDLKKQGKALMRRKRDNQPWTQKELKDLGPFPHTVEGHPVNINDKFNDLVSRSNSLNWMRYTPQ